MAEQINASAYVQGNRLCILGVLQTPYGPIPFSHACECEAKNGPVDFGKDVDPSIQTAIERSQPAIASKIEKEKIRLVAEELVDRTNMGDQNAAAMIVLVRRNAMQHGYPRAVYTYNCMMQYAKNNSARTSVPKALAREITNDEPLHVQTALTGFMPGVSGIQLVSTLANGPELDNTRIKKMLDGFDNEEKRDFTIGFKNWNVIKKAKTQAEKLGKCAGYARAIQRVREPNTSISVLSTDAAWELE